MPTLTLTIKMDNAAFEDDPITEAARILRTLAQDMEKFGLSDKALFDYNGNHVGLVKVTR
jgi:hypothetical protein